MRQNIGKNLRIIELLFSDAHYNLAKEGEYVKYIFNLPLTPWQDKFSSAHWLETHHNDEYVLWYKLDFVQLCETQIESIIA